jgi:rubrerythrin
METNSIPNIQLVNIGTVKKPLNAVKGFIELACWNGYYLVTIPNYRFKNKVVTNGRVELWVDAAITEDNSFSIDPEQLNAYQFLVQQQTEVKQAILEELKKQFPRLLQDEYASWDQDDGSMPLLTQLTADFDFKNFIGPSSISIEEDVKDETAYVKWQFQCLWDPEHGFEVITHKNRVIDIGPEADIFKINKDNGTYDELEKELDNKQWKLPVKKKWWQFWKS